MHALSIYCEVAVCEKTNIPISFSQKLCFYLTAGFAFVALLASLKSVLNHGSYEFALAYITVFGIALIIIRSGVQNANHIKLAIVMIGYFSVAFVQGFSPSVTLVVFVISMGYLLLELLTRRSKDT